jgi:hypothetical protein
MKGVREKTVEGTASAARTFLSSFLAQVQASDLTTEVSDLTCHNIAHTHITSRAIAIMATVPWDRRYDLYAQRAADALPLLRFQPTYHSFQAVATDVGLQLAAINFAYGVITNQNKPEGQEPIPPSEVRRQIHFEVVRRWWASQPTSAAQPTPYAQATQSLLVPQPLHTIRFTSTVEATQPTLLTQPPLATQFTPTAQPSQFISNSTHSVPDPAILCHTAHYTPARFDTTTRQYFAHNGRETHPTVGWIDERITGFRSDASAALFPVAAARPEAILRESNMMFDISSHNNFSNLPSSGLENIVSHTDSSVDSNNNKNNSGNDPG